MKDSYFSDVVLDWALKHPEVKEDFKLTYDYWAPYQAFRIRMEYVPYKHGVCGLLDDDIMETGMPSRLYFRGSRSYV